MLTKQDVIIVVPYYTNDINVFEQISLTQLFRVLGQYPICFVSPESLDIRYEAEGGASYMVERFPDRFFHGTDSYSELCEDPSFYERFADCEYMLIYQTDAFVFADRLLEFCEMGYDYIGAEVSALFWKGLRYQIGNGGFSLRRISAMLRVTEQTEHIMEKLRKRFPPDRVKEIMDAEDQFFAFAAELPELGLRWPPRSTALRFSIEQDVDHCHATLKDALPFGGHYWYKSDFEAWWPIVRSYGYAATDEQIAKWTNHSDFKLRTFCYELIIGNHRGPCRADLKNTLPGGKVRLWGNGEVGQECAKVLRLLDIEIETVFDRDAERMKTPGVAAPAEENLRASDTPIIIGTTHYEQEIAERLSALGYRKGNDYFLWSEIVDRWLALVKAEDPT